MQAQGRRLRVVLNKVGAAQDQRTVMAVHPGRDITQPNTSREGSTDPMERVLYTTVYVDVRC